MKTLSVFLFFLFSYQIPAIKQESKVTEDPCLSSKQQVRDILQIAELDEQALTDNADMLTELLAINDPKVNEILAPHVQKQLELLYQAEAVKAKYRKK